MPDKTSKARRMTCYPHWIVELYPHEKVVLYRTDGEKPVAWSMHPAEAAALALVLKRAADNSPEF